MSHIVQSLAIFICTPSNCTEYSLAKPPLLPFKSVGPNSPHNPSQKHHYPDHPCPIQPLPPANNTLKPHKLRLLAPHNPHLRQQHHDPHPHRPPCLQRYEKMISGMYLGEIVRLLVLRCIESGHLFKGDHKSTFSRQDSFLTKFVSDIERFTFTPNEMVCESVE